VAALAKAKLDLERTRIVSPVNGWVTNLLWRLGDYAAVGERKITLVDADSFWIDGYFEETSLRRIHVGDPATMRLMGSDQLLKGHVEGIARGMTVDNAQPGSGGLQTVNPVFPWVRLAQRIPVRIHIDEVPPAVFLAAGETVTVQIDPPPASAAPARRPARPHGAHSSASWGSSCRSVSRNSIRARVRAARLRCDG
jgi:multidrug resistance efflux pump